MLAHLAAADVQRDLVGNGQGAHNLEGGSGGGDVADGAIDSDAVELNRTGLEYAFPRLCTSLIHPITLNEKFKSRVNAGTKPRTIRKRFGNRRPHRAGSQTRLPAQTSNRSRRSEHESARRSPSVPRGTPQCRHLTRIEGGAPSRQSKTIPKQLMQTILKAGRAI